MKEKSSGRSFDTGNYQQPQQDWSCGHLNDGQLCPLGPNGKGECIIHQICVPELTDSGWQCTRAKAWGGRCKDGPVPDAECPDRSAQCPHQPVPCQPQRTLRNKRRMLTGMTAALSLGCCLAILGGSSGPATESFVDTSAIISPGKLSTHHASLERGCAACHSAATKSPTEILSCVFGTNGSLEDSRKCLECHDNYGSHAMHPHSVSPTVLKDRSAAAKATNAGHATDQRLARALGVHNTTESGELACSTCHAEHHGAAFNLKELTNTQCQSCHASSFHSFANGHPEFKDRKRAFLYFDHATHFEKHFEKSEMGKGADGSGFGCSDCHVEDSSGESMVLANFQNMCAGCHSDQITDDHMPVPLRLAGAPFFSFDVRHISALPPFMELMLLADPKVADAVDSMSRSDGGLPIPAVTAYTTGIQDVFHGLMTQGADFVGTRLRQVAANAGFDEVRAVQAATELEISGFFVALQNAHKLRRAPEVAQTKQPIPGPWSISEDGLSLSYRSRGHADPFLKTWLSLAATCAIRYPESPVNKSDGAFDRLFRQLAAPESSGHCMKCHTIDGLPNGRRRINWNSRHVVNASNAFTKFAHGPHITLLNSETQAHAMGSSPAARCETCHAVASREFGTRKSEFLLDDWMPSPDHNHSATLGLKSVNRQSCVKCHIPGHAGDSCLQCHNYHVHPDKLDER